MQRPESEPVTLNDILITEELFERSPRPPNLQAENQALHSLARQLVNQPEMMLQSLVDRALDLCSAGTAGVSLLETTPNGEEVFRWNVIAGRLAQYVGGTTPRNFSPCGVCLERSTPVLFSHPERYFTYFQAANMLIAESLVLPLIADNYALGTIWIVSHDQQRHFDPEDARVMTSLADFTAAALLLNQRQTHQLLAKNAQLEAEAVERRRAEESSRESEAYFRAITNLVPDLLWRNDLDGNAIWYNQRWLDYTGQTLEEAQGDGWIEVIHPSDRAASSANFRNALKECRPLRQEHRIKGTDGNYRWFLVQANPVTEPDGRVIWFGAATGIHEQRSAIEQLREWEERLKAIIENLPGGAAFVVDRNLRYLLAEGEALYTAGFKPTDLVGHTIFEVLPPQLAANYEVKYRKALAGESFAHEHNAHDRWYISRGTPLRSPNGEVYAVLVVSYDITDRKRAEAGLRESEERLREALVAGRMAYWTWDSATDIVTTSKTMEDLFGLRPGETWQSNAQGFRLVHPDDRERHQTLVEACAKEGKGWHTEFRIIRPIDGQVAWLEERSRAVREPIIGTVRITGLVWDITDRKRHELNAAILDEIGKDLSRLSTPDEIMQTIGSRVGEFLQISGCIFVDVDEAQNELTVHHGWTAEDVPSLKQTFRLEAYLTEDFSRANRAGEAFIVCDTMRDERTDGENYARLRIGSFVTVPFHQHGRWTGHIAVTSPEPRVWRTDEIALLQEISSRIFPRIERARAEEALRTNEERMRGQKEAFQAAVNGAPLEDSLDILAHLAAEETAGEARTAFYIANADGRSLHPVHGAGNMPDSYLKQVDGFVIGEDSLACRLAIPTSRPVVTRDVFEDQLWKPWVYLAQEYDFRSCWSFPIETRDRKGVGTFAMYFREPREASPRDLALAEIVTQSAAVIINSHFEAQERARAETALHESEIQRFREQAAREEERQRAESLAELDRAKTLFFSNISHEFRTPLTLLLAPLQDALSDRTHPLAPPQRERLELAQRNAIRLLKLVNTLLDFSRIEAGRMEALYEPTDLAMFTTELASVFRSAIEQAGLRLIVDCPSLPEPAYVDREMWEKIVLNLLSNAFKFTLEGEITVRLHPADGDARECNGGGDHVMLQIQDTGTGIGPEELPHLFERFYQVRRTKARTHEGSGIGLALVHELIRLHGGTVDVSSTLGQGTCFTITMPLGKAHLPNVSEAGRDSAHRHQLDGGDSPTETLREHITATRTLASTAIGAAPYVEEAEPWIPEESRGSRGRTGAGGEQKQRENRSRETEELMDVNSFASPASPAPPAPPARILLVDDNADMRDYLTRILSEHVQVEAVADGASALVAANERVPDLVLTDVMMPGLDGFELLKALRANPRTREVPLILLSACAGEESLVEGLEAGADDYLIKPFSAGQLVSRVKGHLQMARLRLEALDQERTINRRKDELLSTVSHELNTPLVAILGWTRLLRANPSNQSMLMKSLETIERNATLQAKLIQDLLDISRISAGKLRLSLEPVELESVIQNAIAAVMTAAIAKDIHLHWSIGHRASDEPTPQQMTEVFVLGDRDRLQQIITNLLTNAIKFTSDQGSINLELSVIERQNSSKASYAEISITDTGIGICAEFLPHVFDRFRQAEGSHSAKGLGLGLAIARHLVELHNGTIRAESAGVGQGATFIVRLPLMQQ